VPLEAKVAASSVRVTVPEAPDASVPVEDKLASANVLDKLPVAALVNVPVADSVASANTADSVPDNPLANVPDDERVALANVLDTEPVGAGAENKASFLLARSYAMPRRRASVLISVPSNGRLYIRMSSIRPWNGEKTPSTLAPNLIECVPE
jgi:hypothetical protein